MSVRNYAHWVCWPDLILGFINEVGAESDGLYETPRIVFDGLKTWTDDVHSV